MNPEPTKTAARQGTTDGVGRYVLVISLVLVIIVFGIAYAVYF